MSREPPVECTEHGVGPPNTHAARRSSAAAGFPQRRVSIRIKDGKLKSRSNGAVEMSCHIKDK